ncbi:hypothetical protein JB92DRAFT_3002176, partial [Gautieria morchelliformis]
MPPKLNPTPAYTSNIEVFGESESAGLTPRTPYSRLTANAEEGRSRRLAPAIPVNEDIAEDEDVGNLDEIDLLQSQSHPLLHSSTSESFPMGNGRRRSGSRKKGRIWRMIRERMLQDRLPIGLIVGSAVAFLLLFLIVLSIRRPDTLLDYMGVNATAIAFESLDEESKARFNSSTVIDYAASGYTSYPLTTEQYLDECWKVTNDPRMRVYTSYWSASPGAELDVLHKKSTPSQSTCTSTITYLLDGSVGLMADLAILAQVAIFAREQNRTVFVNDERWNRGRWIDHLMSFSETQPGPEPGCAPPPPEELVACPRTARHWVISAHIAYFHMGEHFQDEFEDPYKYTIERKKPVFYRSSESFAQFIRPSTANEKLIQRARDELALLAPPIPNSTDRAYVSTHIRRGDRKAMSWRYQRLPNVHVPTAEYVDAVLKTHARMQNLSSDGSPSFPLLVYLASDSPSAASEFTQFFVTNNSVVQRDGNETLKPVIYELRTSKDSELRSLAPAVEYVQAEWNNRTKEDRVRETRGAIVDWALLSGAWTSELGAGAQDVLIKPAAAVCTLPSNFCKLAAVGLGWNR